MNKIFFILILFLFIIGLVEAATVSLSVAWQLSSNVTKPGSDSTVYVTLTNTGTDLSGIIITPTAGPYIKITSGYKLELGDLPASSSQQAAISIKADENATSTTSYVFLEIIYYYSNSQYKKTLYIPVTIKREPILQIKNVNFSKELEPGNTVFLTFDLKNEGIGDAKDITVSLTQTSNFIVSSSSGEFFVSILSKSESKTLTIPITVSPDALIGTTTIPIKLTYYDETRTNNYTETKEIGALITGKYNFIVTAESQDIITAGTSGFITIKIANAGNEEARYTTVKVIQSNNFDISPTIIYVGNLKSDDYDSEKLSLNVGPVEPGYYPVSLQITYKDSFGKSYDEIYSVNAKVYSKAEYSLAHQTQSPFSMLVIIVIVIVVFFIAYKKGYLNKLFRRK
jgi:hypothetical protein